MLRVQVRSKEKVNELKLVKSLEFLVEDATHGMSMPHTHTSCSYTIALNLLGFELSIVDVGAGRHVCDI